MSLTEFLLARIAEDEECAEFWKKHAWVPDHCMECGGLAGEGVPEFDPARVLAECEAKRRIVEMAQGSSDFTDAMPRPAYAEAYHSPSVDILIRVQQLLALPYADHPDFQPEWRIA